MSARRLDPVRKSFAARFAEGDTYGTLLVLIVAAYVIMAVVEDSKWARTVTGALFGATLLLALHTSHVRGRIIRIAVAIVVVMVVWSAALAATDHEPFKGSTPPHILLIARGPGRDPLPGLPAPGDQRRDDPRRDRRLPPPRDLVRGDLPDAGRRRPALLRAGRGLRREVPLLQLRGDHDARVRRPHAAHRHRAA